MNGRENGTERAEKLLKEGGYTCVLEKDGRIFTSTERGIRPLIRLLDEGADFKGGFAADKIVGRAAAFLYVRLGIGGLYADVLGKGGRSLLEAHGIPVRFGALAERIINRAGTDLCPMEKATEEISDPEEAERALRKKLEELRSGTL